MLPGLLALLASVRSVPAEPVELDGLELQPGRRFAELRFRTPVACRPWVSLRDGSLACKLREAPAAPAREHRFLLPLAANRRLLWSVGFEDGTSTAARQLPAAQDWTASLSVRQAHDPAGALRLEAVAGRPGRWTLQLPGGPVAAVGEGASGPVTAALFPLGKLGPDEELRSATVIVRAVDGSCRIEAGPLFGNRRLAAETVSAVGRLDLERLTALAIDPKMDEPRFRAAVEARFRAAGAPGLLRAVQARVVSLLEDQAVLDSKATLSLTRGLCRLQQLDSLVRNRGWKPLELGAAGAGRYSDTRYLPAAPEPAGVKPLEVWRAVSYWNERLGGPLEGWSTARTVDTSGVAALQKKLYDSLPGVLSLMDRGRPFLVCPFRLEPSLLEGPRVVLAFRTGNLGLGDFFNVMVNDRALFTLCNRKETFPGYVLDRYKGGAITHETLVTSWMAVSVPSSLFVPGENSLVLTAESARADVRAAGYMLVAELRIAAR